MIKIKLDWNKENVGEFVRYSTAPKSKSHVFLTVAFYVVIAIIIALCIVMYAMTGEWLAIVGAGVSVIVAIVYNVGFRMVKKNLTNNILDLNLKTGFESVEVDYEKIVIHDSLGPLGKISWSNVTKIEKNNECGAVYITTCDNAMILIEYKNITEGTREELDGIFEGMNEKLSKDA